MRYFLLMLSLILLSARGFGQGKGCPFLMDQNTFVDSVTSRQLLDTIKTLPLKSYNRKGKMPRYIKKGLKCALGEFRIANPGHAFRESDAIGLFGGLLPSRQLLYLGLNEHYLLMTYKIGGAGVGVFTLLFKFDNHKVLNNWAWLGGIYNATESKEVIILSLQDYPALSKRRYGM